MHDPAQQAEGQGSSKKQADKADEKNQFGVVDKAPGVGNQLCRILGGHHITACQGQECCQLAHEAGPGAAQNEREKDGGDQQVEPGKHIGSGHIVCLGLKHEHEKEAVLPFCNRINIADLADCASLPEKALHETDSGTSGTDGAGKLDSRHPWPQLVESMLASSAAWMGIVREKGCLAVLPLDFLNLLGHGPDRATLLQVEGILAAQELERLHSFTHAKRQGEWLGGRLAAKCAVGQFCGIDDSAILPAAWSIANDAHGRPFLNQNHSLPSCADIGATPHLSISHSGSFAAALAAAAPCGLDIQKIEPKLLRLQARFARPPELALGEKYDGLIWLGMLWAAKEAVKKCRYADQPIFMEGVQVIAHRGCATGLQGAVLSCHLEETLEIVAVQLRVKDGYALAVAL